MKPAKISDLRNMTEAELQNQITTSERSLQDMQFQKAIGTLEDLTAIRVVRRDIAKMKTILNERTLEAAK